jgi:copper chaperone CopZ
MDQYTLDVKGMACAGCEEAVTTAAKGIDGVHRVDADHEAGAVDVTAESRTEAAVRDSIHDAGYDISA